MDFQPNTQPDNINEQTPAQEPSTVQEQATVQEQPIQQQPTAQEQPIQQQPAAQEQPIQQQPAVQEPPIYETAAGPNQPTQGQPMQQPNMPGNGNMPMANGNPYNHNPYQNGQPYQNNRPYQNNAPYGGGYPNNNYPNNNAYPYYNRGAYQVPYAEPGSNLANVAMILGIISILASFTFTVYPAFILGSIAIVLALLSKGSRSGFFQKAKTGIICGTIGLITNTLIIVFSFIFVFSNPEAKEMFDQVFEQQYGMSFEEMMEEINDSY